MLFNVFRDAVISKQNGKGYDASMSLKARWMPPVFEAAVAWGMELFFNVLTLESKNIFTIR